ncbi:CFEM domain protein, putative [Paecilomyces variotii No. 5]|uniref:CFEM domain protein, putative n=1 Tax=Byssochlamys spectabilis (strain No. 5 / NBRC 109023) TaxID=1356009 RepID=V5G692_BYSSN|nr:CFEM domain protein, putative [Paecilomyces variotii No. 5]
MKFSAIIVAFSALLGTAAAQSQDLSALPDCAKNCALGSIPKSCSLIDVKCICTTGSFIDSISCCIKNACSPKDQDATLKFAKQICGSAGVTDLPNSVTCSSSASGTATSAASTGASSTAGAAAATSTSGSGSGSGSATTPVPGSVPTGAAILSTQNHNAGFVAVVGALAAGIGMTFAR